MQWCSAPPQTLLWRVWEGQAVVRNARTGSIHLLSPCATKVFTALVTSTSAVLLSDLARQCIEEVGEETSNIAALTEVLTEFERLGLAEPQQP